jgi:hypothetical protein
MPQPDARLVNAANGARPMIGWALRAFVGAMLVGIFAGVTRYDEVWTPVQRLDFSSYVRASVISTIGFTASGRYNLLFVVDRHGRHLVTDDTAWQVPIGGAPSWIPSETAKAAGFQRLEWTTATYAHAALAAFFRDAVYAGQSPFALYAPSLRSTGLTFAALLFFACVNDLMRHPGRRIRGSELVTPRLFHRRLRADGLTIFQQPGRVARRFGWQSRVRLSRRLETHHTLVMGDIGAGTSAVIRQILRQIAARGERAIVYDPALEFLPECYDESRGDVILNPLDQRSPYWTPADEVLEPPDALTVATALVSDHPQAGRDAVAEVSRRLVVHLLSARTSPSDLATWLAHPAELNARLAGTAEARILARLTPEQRTSVLASLNVIADALKLLPEEPDATARWSAAEWAWHGRGWVFLTSPPPMRERLRPVTSLWLDLLLRRLMDGTDGTPRTWVVVNDVASLDRLPHLSLVVHDPHTRTPLVLGVRGRSRVDARYGPEAEALLSRPATKIFLRTTEPRAATWIADTVGRVEVEIERVPGPHPTPGVHPHYGGLDRQVYSLVLDSEIMRLPDRHGWLCVHGLVVPLHLADRPPIVKRPKFLPRPHKPGPLPPPPVPASSPTDESPLPAPPLAPAPAPRRVYR